jgi:hypothetical protein
MAEMISGDYDAVTVAAELKNSKVSNKDAKNKHKVEARRRIDDLMEQKRLRQILDLDDEEELEMDYLG